MTIPALALGERAATEVAANAGSVAVDLGEADRPDVLDDNLARMKPRYTRCRALMVGIEAIRLGGVGFLSPLEGESTGSYEFRRTLCALHNGFQRTVHAAVGFLLEKPPELGHDMPQPLKDFAENVDRAQTHLNVFTRKLLTAGMTDGYAGIMTEHMRPDDPTLNRAGASAAATPGQPLDASDEAALGLRPYFLLYKVDDVVKLIKQRVNGAERLVVAVFKETVRQRVGLFGIRKVQQYRVYRDIEGTITSELWEAKDGSAPTMVGTPLPISNQVEIPWSPLPAGNEIAKDEYMPPLQDLCELNIEHHQCKTNIRSLEMLACVPTIVRVGAEPDKEGHYPPITLGPRSTSEVPRSDPPIPNPLYWLSPDIAVLAPAQESLNKIESQMGAAGAAFLSPDTRAAETAEARRIDTSAQRATLQTVRQTAQDCLERAFGYAGRFMGVESGSITLNADFSGEGMDASYLQVLLGAYQAGALTLEEFRYVVQTGQLPEDFNAELGLVAGKIAAAQLTAETTPAPASAGRVAA